MSDHSMPRTKTARTTPFLNGRPLARATPRVLFERRQHRRDAPTKSRDKSQALPNAKCLDTWLAHRDPRPLKQLYLPIGRPCKMLSVNPAGPRGATA